MNEFLIEYNSSDKNNKYALRKRLMAYINVANYDTQEARDVYFRLLELYVSDYKHLFNSLTEDLKELDMCYEAGAYKATLIMAGSILESFLLDWLSEIDGKDYFNEPYKVKETDSNGIDRWKTREELYVYIEQIKEIEKPEWMESSEKAHFIRNQRNSVHLKVCLKKEIMIDKDICQKVITYLKEIIDTRLAKQMKKVDRIKDRMDLMIFN